MSRDDYALSAVAMVRSHITGDTDGALHLVGGMDRDELIGACAFLSGALAESLRQVAADAGVSPESVLDRFLCAVQRDLDEWPA